MCISTSFSILISRFHGMIANEFEGISFSCGTSCRISGEEALKMKDIDSDQTKNAGVAVAFLIFFGIMGFVLLKWSLFRRERARSKMFYFSIG